MQVARERGGAIEAAVADAERARALAQAARRGLGHLAGAEQEHGVVAEAAEDAAGEVDRDARDAHRPGADGRLRAHALGHGERAVTHRAERALERPGGDGRLVGLLDLPEDLRLAEHHRVEARRDAEHVLDRVVAALVVEIRREVVAAAGAAVAGQLLADGAQRRVDARRRPTAARARRPRRDCRSRETAPRRARVGPRAARALRAARRPRRELLAHIDGRRPVRETDDDDHAGPPRPR